MPTIDDLPAAISVSDTDELLVSQVDIARKATRAQLLAGVQPALGLASGTLLGRMSAGFGSPEQIAVGANLTLANGRINAPAAFQVSGLAMGATPASGDLVPLGQGGQNAAVSFSTFAAALAGLPGLDQSNAVAAPTGGVGARRLADLFSDAISIESFGAAGDGVTDDTAAFEAALESGRAILLDARIYLLNGPLVISTATALIGVPGFTTIRRTGLLSSGNWLTLAASQFIVSGVDFDAGNLTAADSAALTIYGSCQVASFFNCSFLNATGVTTGHGVSVTGSTTGQYSFRECQFANNAVNGAQVVSAEYVSFDRCSGLQNGACGISVVTGIACAVRDCHLTQNQIGIGIGAWQGAVNTGWTPTNCTIHGNCSTGNSLWGIAAAANGLSLCDNAAQGNGNLAVGGAVLVRALNGRVIGNKCTGGTVGLDARTSQNTIIVNNHCWLANNGIEVGACQNVVVAGNFCLQNGWAIYATAYEPTLSPTPTGPVSIERNWIGFTSALGGGINVLDAASGVSVTDNDINGWGSATSAQALWLHTDAIVISGNRWNNIAQFQVASATVAMQPSLVFPDTADEILVTSAPPAVSAILSEHQVATLGQITFIKTVSGGSGYTLAEATITGSGAGATANVVCSNGSVVGFQVTSAGSGYGAIGAQANVTITGDGVGAAAEAFVGLPVPSGRNFRLICACPVQLSLNGASPVEETWSHYTLGVPAYGAVDLVGAFGGWYAVQSPPVDYLAPTGDGGAVLQSVGGGNLVLRPSGGGGLYISSSAEPLGCTSNVGRGDPSGTVTAPPGSDFRNLDGGAGSTFWIKASGTDSNGWVAVA